jgi:hypothetical protein
MRRSMLAPEVLGRHAQAELLRRAEAMVEDVQARGGDAKTG